MAPPSRLVVRLTPEQLTSADLNDFVIVERICSTFSLLGCFFIAITFLGSDAFHKPINRLVFYASMGNIFTNVATIISRSALSDTSGALCQFQAFLIQTFMPADAYWTLAMAINVYLTFYFKFDACSLRRLEKYYFMICYGVPCIIALAYLGVKTEDKGRMYGNATLWCWIASDWDVVRIATFYGPVWVVILLSSGIYVRAGREIYAKRKQLRNFRICPPDPLPILGDPFQSIRTTEVYVTSESAESRRDSFGSINQEYRRPEPARQQHYTVTVSTAQQSPRKEPRYSYAEKPMPPQREGNCSIPISAYGPNSGRGNLYPTRRYAAMAANNAAWSYTKVACLFFVAMMITWIPSSANRVFSVVYPGHISLVLEFASAFVLPLQGFWNALIYTTTSLPACRQVWTQLKERKRWGGGGLQAMAVVFPPGDNKQKQNREQWMETDSMTELASRPETDGSCH